MCASNNEPRLLFTYNFLSFRVTSIKLHRNTALATTLPQRTHGDLVPLEGDNQGFGGPPAFIVLGDTRTKGGVFSIRSWGPLEQGRVAVCDALFVAIAAVFRAGTWQSGVSRTSLHSV